MRSSRGEKWRHSSAITLRILDAIKVTLGPGLAVQEIITGFESRVVILKNVPGGVTLPQIKAVVSPFGDILDIRRSESHPGNTTVKVVFVDHRHASEAAKSLDGRYLFGVCLATCLASQQCTALGKGVVHDGDVMLTFPAPCKSAFVGYPTLEAAKNAIRIADRAQMGDYILHAYSHSGMPQLGTHTVKFDGLPVDAEADEMIVFGPNTGTMFTRQNYRSLDDALLELQYKLETYGELVSIRVIGPPFEKQSVRAWAHFTSSSAAKRASKDYNRRRPWYFGQGTVQARYTMSISYHLPKRVFNVLEDMLRQIRDRFYNNRIYCDVVFRTQYINEDRSVGVKLVSEDLAILTNLKNSFEEVIRGEVVRLDSQVVWDPLFARAPGAAFIASLERDHPMVLIQVDKLKSCIRLFGSPSRASCVRKSIQHKAVELRIRKIHSIPLDHEFLPFFLHSALRRLQQDLGPENVYIDPWTSTLKVHGDQDAIRVANLLVNGARQAPRPQMQSRGESEADCCPVCLDKVSLPITLECGHTWCKECLSDYLRSAIDTKSFPLLCLGGSAHCQHRIPLEVARALLSSEEFEKVVHASFLAYIHSRPSEFHYCPTPDCQQVYRTAPPDVVLQCPSCMIRICGSCHVEFHEGKRCADPEKEEFRKFSEWSTGRDVQRCPECKTFIERESGCNHMTCIRCRMHICWVCLETFSESRECYDHLQKVHGGIGL